MKKSTLLLLVVSSFIFKSCSSEESKVSDPTLEGRVVLSRVFGLASNIEESEPADATLTILGQSVSNINNSAASASGQLSIGPDTNLVNQNIGDILINDIVIRHSDNYNKSYDQTQTIQESNDVGRIFGQNVNVRNINCSGSALCNFNFTVPMLHKFRNGNIVGLQDQFFINKNTGFSLTWDSSNIAADEIIGVVIVGANPNAKVGDISPSFAKLALDNGTITISAADLNDFPVGSLISIQLAKGKSYTNTLTNGKKMRIIAGDILHFSGTLR